MVARSAARSLEARCSAKRGLDVRRERVARGLAGELEVARIEGVGMCVEPNKIFQGALRAGGLVRSLYKQPDLAIPFPVWGGDLRVEGSGKLPILVLLLGIDDTPPS